MVKVENKSATLPRSWKKSFSNGIVISVKLRFCNEYGKEKPGDMCNNQVNENKQFEANLNLLKRQAPNDIGHLLPYFKD